jgi:hypothetical protein
VPEARLATKRREFGYLQPLVGWANGVSMVEQNPWQIGWAAVEAFATAFAASSVIFAALQLRFDRRNAAVERTLQIMDEWNAGAIQDILYYLDRPRFNGDPDANREAIRQLYWRVRSHARARGSIDDALGRLSRLTERMELLRSRRLIDGRLLAEHIGYEILEAYYVLQDVLVEEAVRNYDFSGFYGLACAMQQLYRRIRGRVPYPVLDTARFLRP